MANNNNIKNVIRNNIYNNTKQEISGNRLRDVLLAMVNSLTAGGYIFKGVMSPSSEIETPDERVFYFSSTAGDYPVGEITISASEFAVIYFDTTWHKEVLAVPTSASLAAEVLARTNADTAEATTRATADAALGQRIDNISAIGRFLSVWNCSTGLPTTNPTTSPYTYHTGDYYLVGMVGGSNFKPSGSQYVIGEASTAVESDAVAVGDVYMYDGSTWKLLANSARAVLFSQLQGSPMDNDALAAAFNAKANSADVYTKTAVDALLNAKANAADVYTKIAADALLAAKANTTDVTALGGRVTTIEGKIPAQATSANQLADKDFVNSSIATNTATFRGTFDLVEGGNVTLAKKASGESLSEKKQVLGELFSDDSGYRAEGYEDLNGNCYWQEVNGQILLYIEDTLVKTFTSSSDTLNITYGGEVFAVLHFGFTTNLYLTRDDAWKINDYYGGRFIPNCITWNNSPSFVADDNDYVYIRTKEGSSDDTFYDRCKWTANNRWEYEYTLNNSSFTANQWSAINSGITPSLVAKIHDQEIFIATYGVTSYADVLAAINANKAVFAKVSSNFGMFTYKDSSTNDLYFSSTTSYLYLWKLTSENAWITITSAQIQTITAKVTTLAEFKASKTSTSNYPSNKAIAEYVDEVAPFVAVYNQTTYADLLAAVNANKAIFIRYNDLLAQFIFKDSSDTLWFSANTSVLRMISITSAGVWSYYDITAENAANKTSDIAGNATDTTKYTTPKGVADYVTAIVGSIGTILDEINGEEI